MLRHYYLWRDLEHGAQWRMLQRVQLEQQEMIALLVLLALRVLHMMLALVHMDFDLPRI